MARNDPEGTNGTPPVMLLHRLGSAQLDWRDTADALIDAGCPTATIDLRGYSLSTRGRDPFSIRQHAADVLSVPERP